MVPQCVCITVFFLSGPTNCLEICLYVPLCSSFTRGCPGLAWHSSLKEREKDSLDFFCFLFSFSRTYLECVLDLLSGYFPFPVWEVTCTVISDVWEFHEFGKFHGVLFQRVLCGNSISSCAEFSICGKFHVVVEKGIIELYPSKRWSSFA